MHPNTLNRKLYQRLSAAQIYFCKTRGSAAQTISCALLSWRAALQDADYPCARIFTWGIGVANFENIQIGFEPFDLSIEIGDAKTEPCIRGADVQLCADDVKFPNGTSTTAVATDVMEYICAQLYKFGIVVHYTIEAYEGERYMKSVSVSRLYGRDFSKGTGKRVFEAKSFTDDSNCWKWRVSFTKPKTKDKKGRGLDALDSIPLAGVRSIIFDFGVAPPTS
ncbi:hypothetical protein KUV51_08885 [Tateyamaria omphalii]|uniref:hypothetical protein n=1 Tax=Tateyamaria omphalii TaxID=299262 RepID=UPI001C993187|nr:hypothetical protein [Tateyamaria omphalii]MBY5933108.1 hypothetical protein [Tateyamaria omphalii]